MIGQMMRGAAAALGDHRRAGGGAGGRHLLGRFHFRRRRPAPALRHGLRGHRTCRRGVRRGRLRLGWWRRSSCACWANAGFASGAVWAWRGLRDHGAGASAEVEFAGIMLSGVSFYMLHTHAADPRHADGAGSARCRAMALFALCLFVGQAIGVPSPPRSSTAGCHRRSSGQRGCRRWRCGSPWASLAGVRLKDVPIILRRHAELIGLLEQLGLPPSP